jgi:hypothetical protein
MNGIKRSGLLEKLTNKVHIGLSIMLVLYGVIFYPSNPKFDSHSKDVVEGRPKFVKTSAMKGSITVFMVGQEKFHCGYGFISGGNGCWFIESRLLNHEENVIVTYQVVINKFGFRYKTIQSVSQHGKNVVSVLEARKYLSQSYEGLKRTFYSIVFLFLITVIISYQISKKAEFKNE